MLRRHNSAGVLAIDTEHSQSTNRTGTRVPRLVLLGPPLHRAIDAQAWPLARRLRVVRKIRARHDGEVQGAPLRLCLALRGRRRARLGREVAVRDPGKGRQRGWRDAADGESSRVQGSVVAAWRGACEGSRWFCAGLRDEPGDAAVLEGADEVLVCVLDDVLRGVWRAVWDEAVLRYSYVHTSKSCDVIRL